MLITSDYLVSSKALSITATTENSQSPDLNFPVSSTINNRKQENNNTHHLSVTATLRDGGLGTVVLSHGAILWMLFQFLYEFSEYMTDFEHVNRSFQLQLIQRPCCLAASPTSCPLISAVHNCMRISELTLRSVRQRRARESTVFKEIQHLHKSQFP